MRRNASFVAGAVGLALALWALVVILGIATEGGLPR